MLQTLHRTLIAPVIDFIYPPLCLICKKYVETGERTVCSSCWSEMKNIDFNHPVWQELKIKFIKIGAINDFLSCYLFEKEGNFQQVVHSLKYEGMKSLGVRLGRDIGARMMLNSNFPGGDFLIPVPLHSLKKRERGYNQCEFICRGISEMTNIPVEGSFVIRKKYTQSQTQLNIEERKENVGDAFMVTKNRMTHTKGKTFIIVDDVITTGATVNACATELIVSGAARVFAASAALAQ